MRILFLSAWCPLPADNGSKLRIANLLRGLAARHTVDLLGFAPELPSDDALRDLRAICDTVELLPETPFAQRMGGRLRGLLSARPRSVVANHSPAMAAAVRVHAGRGYDLVIASQLHMAPYALLVPDTPRLLEEIELGIIRDQYMAQNQPIVRARYGLTWWKTSAYVARLLQGFAGAATVSEPERAFLRTLAPHNLQIAVVPNGVDMTACQGDFGPPIADTLIYPGALSYEANMDAVAYFAGAILPRIQAARPHVRLRVTGHTTPDQIAALSGAEGIDFTGYLDDVRPMIARSWAEVVPLRKGGGTRLKVLEALALGTPVIATAKGAEGLDLLPERDLLIADTPDNFAEQTLRLLGSPALRAELATNGRRAAAGYDWSVSVRRLEDLIEAIVGVVKA